MSNPFRLSDSLNPYPDSTDTYEQLIASSMAAVGRSLRPRLPRERDIDTDWDNEINNDEVYESLEYPDPTDDLEEGTPPYYKSSEEGQPSRSPKLRLLPADEEDAQHSDSDYQPEASPSESDPKVDEYPSALTIEEQDTPTNAARNSTLPVSKLQAKKIRLKKQGIDLDTNGTRKGLVRYASSGSLEYRHDEAWVPAVYHYQLRQGLIELMDTQGRYDEEPISGADRWDRTAFKAQHKHWKFDRSSRPEVLFLWDDPGNRDDRLPDIWKDADRVVLTSENRPLRRWRELPLTLSGQCEGWRLEAFRRLNPNISLNELKGRMPPTTSKRQGLANKPIGTPALANRMARDRCRIGAKPWCMKEGSDIKVYRMLETIPTVSQNQILHTGSTHCYRDLKNSEIEYIEAGNKGTENAYKKAGARRLPDEIRQEREELKQQRAKAKGADGIDIYPVTRQLLEKRTSPAARPTRPHRRHVATKAPRTSTLPPPPRTEENLEKGEYISSESINELAGPRPSKRAASSFLDDAPSKRTKYWAIDEATDESGVEEHDDEGVSEAEANTNGQKLTMKPRQNLSPDMRQKKPATALECISIQEALNITLDDYERYVGYPPPIRTDRTQSYAHQLSELTHSLSQQHGLGDKAPMLKQWGRWTGSIDSWKALKAPGFKPADTIATGSRTLEGFTLIGDEA